MTQFEVATAATFVALAAARVEVGGDRGRAGRPARRDQHDPLAGHGADLDRPRPHRVAGGDRARDRRREAGGPARPDDPGPRPGLAPRSRRWPSAPRPSAARALVARPRTPARRCGCAPRAASSAATSPSPAPPPRPSSASSTPSAVAEVAADADDPGPAGADRRAARRPSSTPPTTPTAPPPWPRRCPRSPAGRRVVACLAILADKDAAAMVAALAPALDRAVCTELPAAALDGHGRPGAALAPGRGAGRGLRRRPGLRGRGGAGLRRRPCARARELAARAARGRPARHRLPLRARRLRAPRRRSATH